MKNHIERNPAIMGGCWVVRGGRVPLRFLSGYHRKGMSFKDISMIMYPHLSPETLENAVREYREIYPAG